MNQVLDFDCELEDFDYLENQNDINSFFSEITPIIKKCINKYFFEKTLYDGSQIDKEILELQYYTELLLNTNMLDGVSKAYKMIDEYNFLEENLNDSISPEIRYMIKLIERVQKYVPQEFVGGMILMHLELIEGMEIW
jgi:cell fate (sporulation/competence/biofilm development) regulator YlbF (YheA/YmcA/DUF963 family)